ncbi:MAG: ACT domain-containing protein [Pseudomonadota bacterium]
MPSLSSIINQTANQNELGPAIKGCIADFSERLVLQSNRRSHLARSLGLFIDDGVNALIERAVGETSAKLSVCAVGGFGRLELAPSSDLDLLFLHKERGDERLRTIVNGILYPLWDAGFTVGHAVLTPSAAMKSIRDDLMARTAYLEARFIAGDVSPFDDFRSRFAEFRRRTASDFVKAKRTEQTARHRAAARSRYYAEPDLKEGRGALRDIQHMRWLARYLHPSGLSWPPLNFDTDDRERLEEAERFLWAIRFHLHQLRGKGDDRLTFEFQPALADRLGYAERSNAKPAERLMKHFFLNALEISRVQRLFDPLLDNALGVSGVRAKKVSNQRQDVINAGGAAGQHGIVIRSGLIDFRSRSAPLKSPASLLALFAAAAASPEKMIAASALSAARAASVQIDRTARKRPEISGFLLEILIAKGAPGRALRMMAEVGLLARIAPAFGRIIGVSEYGLYKQYALHEQIFQALDLLSGIRRGEMQAPARFRDLLSDGAVRELAVTLFIYEMRSREGKKSAQRTLERIAKELLHDAGSAARVARVASAPLAMIDTAERRTVADPASVVAFADKVGNAETLKLYYLMSIIHLNVVALGAFDSWIERQLDGLYTAAEAAIDGGRKAAGARIMAMADDARNRALKRAKQAPGSGAREKWLMETPASIASLLEPADLLRLADTMRAASAARSKTSVSVTQKANDLEAFVCARDRPGLLADLAAGAAAAGVSIRRVDADTTYDGWAVDLFTVSAPIGAPALDLTAADALREAFTHAAINPSKTKAPKKRIGDRRQLFDPTIEVVVDTQSSDSSTILEAFGRDRPGLLAALARALADVGVIVKSAHAATRGERSIDAFYVQDAPGYKIVNARRLTSLKRRLLNVLNDDA